MLLMQNSRHNPITSVAPNLQLVFAEDEQTVGSLGAPDLLGLGVGRLVESEEELHRLFHGTAARFEVGRWVVVLIEDKDPGRS